jgi:hypothetical protein
MNDIAFVNRKATALFLVAVAATTAMWAMPATAGQIYLPSYSTSSQADMVGVYDATTGATLNAAQVPGLFAAYDVALSGPNLFVVNSPGGKQGNGRIGEYDAATGTAVNAALISGLFNPNGIALSGSNLFISDSQKGTIGEYTTSGATVNATLITGLNNPGYIALSGSNLFVPNAGNGTIGKYTTSGVTVNAAFISGLNRPLAVAVSGSNLFVANTDSNTIGEYDATTGATVNAALVTLHSMNGLNDLEVYGGNLFVEQYLDVNNARIGEYNATTGAPVNAALITGLQSPWGFAIVPEPSSLVLCGLGAVGLLCYLLSRRRTA